MAQNVVINGVTYNGVDSITIPTSNGGKAEYKDATAFETWVCEMENGAIVEKVVYIGA
jgi:hypothetical protein